MDPRSRILAGSDGYRPQTLLPLIKGGQSLCQNPFSKRFRRVSSTTSPTQYRHIATTALPLGRGLRKRSPFSPSGSAMGCRCGIQQTAWTMTSDNQAMGCRAMLAWLRMAAVSSWWAIRLACPAPTRRRSPSSRRSRIGCGHPGRPPDRQRRTRCPRSWAGRPVGFANSLTS